MAARWTEPDSDLLREMSQSGSSLKEMADAVGRPMSATRHQCRKLGIKYRDTRGDAARERLIKWTPERLEELAEQVGHRPIAEVAPEFGVSERGLQDVMYRYGIKGRERAMHTPEEIERRVAPLRGREKVDRTVPRECSKCHVVKQPEEFRQDRNSGRICKECSNNARRMRWNDLDDDERNRQMTVIRWKRHGLTPEQGMELIEKQGGLCALCHKELGARVHVDHDHACCPDPRRTCGNCIRGIVHQRCNNMLGWHEAAIAEGLVEAIEAYLAKPTRPSDTRHVDTR